MIEIRLTQGQVAIIDDCDAHLAELRWYAEKREQTYYATRNLPKVNGRNAGVIRLHRAILDVPPGMEIDHINGNGLDCRRCNLRVVTPKQNQANRRKQQTKTYTPYKGVYWHKRGRCWWSQIQVDGRLKFLGNFSTAEEAARAYDKALRERFGEYARLNLPGDLTPHSASPRS